jgi:serine/threonine-protein kinase
MRVVTPALLSLLALGIARAEPAEMVRVPGGTFRQGATDREPDERPVRRVRLRPFRIDRLEVTRASYRECVRAGACRPARKYPGAVGPHLPVVGVSWHDAAAYCAWRGKRLPTEAEWERAARGTDGRRFPWGEPLECKRANFGNFAGAGPCAGQNPGKVVPVGQRPGGVSPVGAEDMAGNVWEWTADPYRSYRSGRLAAPADHRVVRGGSCCSYFAMPTTTNRLAFPADYADRDIGFRCAD